MKKIRIVEDENCTLTKRLLVLTVMLLLCIALHALIMSRMTDDPLNAYITLIRSAFSSKSQVVQTCIEALPIMMVGLGVSLCLRAGVLNLGGNGCVIAGGIGACIMALNYENVPKPVAIFLTIVLSMLFGGLWSGLAGWLRAKLKISEIYVTVMLNYIMVYLASYLINNVWRSQLNLDYSDQIFENYRWPALIQGTYFHIGFLLLAVAFIIVEYINHSPKGFEIRAHGSNPYAFRFKIKDQGNMRLIIMVMVFSGALAGLAGASQVCGHQFRFSSDINQDFGFTGIIAAKLGNLNPIAIIIASFFLGILGSGATAMQLLTGVPDTIVDVLEGMLLVTAILSDQLSRYRIEIVTNEGEVTA